MRHGSLFSGIGGFDLAAEWMGWQNIFHCEWNDFGKQVLKYYWPESISYDDITKTDFTIHRGQIDILTGGFPCQPYSQAGKRLGKEDDRHLFPEMLRAIREIAPTWVVGENVRGLVNWSEGLVFDEVQADLEAEGYEVQPFLLPACAVNAPHRRDRIWFVAYSNHTRTVKRLRNNGNGQKENQRREEQPFFEFGTDSETVTNTNSQRHTIATTGKSNSTQWKIHKEEQGDRHGIRAEIGRYSRPTPYANSNGLIRSNSKHEVNSGKGRKYALYDTEQDATTDTGSSKLQRCQFNRSIGKKRSTKTENGQFSRPISSDWSNFPTQSPICGRDDGFPSELDRITFSKWRNESIKAYGNAIVPQVALQIFKAISEYNFLNNKTE